MSLLVVVSPGVLPLRGLRFRRGGMGKRVDLILNGWMKLNTRIIRVNRGDKKDDVFGVKAHSHPQLTEYLNKIVWLDTGEPVAGLGSFAAFGNAELYIHIHREKMINRNIEDILLVKEI